MSRVIPPGFADVAMRFTLSGDTEPIYITFGCDISDVPDAPDMSLASTLMESRFFDNTCPGAAMSNAYTLTGIVWHIGQDGGPPVIFEAALSHQCPNGSAPLPQNCAVLVRKRTARSGREGKGRLYWPGFSEASVDAAGMLSSATVTDLTSRWEAFRTGLAAGNGSTVTPMVLLHTSPQQGELPNPTPITSLVVDGRIATQRRRLRH